MCKGRSLEPRWWQAYGIVGGIYAGATVAMLFFGEWTAQHVNNDHRSGLHPWDEKCPR